MSMRKQQAGWNIEAWCEAVGISDRSFWNLPPEIRPESVKLLTRRIVIEPPSDYLKRLAAMQREPA